MGKYPLATVRIKADFVRPVFAIVLFKVSYSCTLSLAEKDSLVARVQISQTKIKEINEKAEKSSVECMRKLCEES